MPGKKKAPEEKKVLFGRASNTLRMGIVGLPNVGKSTTFNLLSNLSVPAENFPFCTIDPNLAKVNIPDKRYEKLVAMYKPKSRVPATLSITDIAGLVPGASEGQGLGNAFLSHISATDGIYHVVRAFRDPDVVHSEGEVNPVRDLQIIHDELAAKDRQHLAKRMEDATKVIARTNSKDAKEELAAMEKADDMLKNGKWIKDGAWSGKEIEILNAHLLLTAKPVVYLANISATEYQKKSNPFLPKILEWIKAHNAGPLIPYSADFEQQVAALEDEAERKAFCEAQGAASIIPKIIRVGYNALDLIHFFTSGEDEVRCWTIRRGTKAPQAAGVIHTDFEHGFICAEVMKYSDLVELETEAAVKAEGKYLQKGKEYLVEDGDIIYFLKHRLF